MAGSVSQVPAALFTQVRLPKISAAAAQRLRRLSVAREPVGFAAGWTLAVAADPAPDAWSENGIPVEIELRIDGETGHLRTVWPVLETLLHRAEPRIGIQDVDDEMGAMLLEAHLLDAVERLEQHLGIDCAFLRIAAPEEHDDLARMALRIRRADAEDDLPAMLFASPRVLGILASAWERQPRLPGGLRDIGFPVAARVAVSTLSRGALRRVAVGDALLLDRIAPDGGVVVSLGDHLFAAAQLNEDGAIVLVEPLSADSPLLLGEFSMMDSENDTDSGAAALEHADADALPVKLVFEIGRREVTLDELRGWGVGAPIPLGRPASTAVDVVANGRRIGAGEIVQIGDQLGVRITQLNGA